LLQNPLKRAEVSSKTASKIYSKNAKEKCCFFKFRLLDYSSTARTVGYTKFDNTVCDFQIVSTLLSRKNINLYASQNKNAYRFIIVLLNFLSDFIIAKALI
jgi:hypothetical protein